MSQTTTGKVRNITGQRLKGASARVEIAPAANAVAARRHPQASMTHWAKRASGTTIANFGGFSLPWSRGWAGEEVEEPSILMAASGRAWPADGAAGAGEPALSR